MGRPVVASVIASVIDRLEGVFPVFVVFAGPPLSFRCSEGPMLRIASKTPKSPITKPITEAITVITIKATTDPITDPITDVITDPTTRGLFIGILRGVELPFSGAGPG